MAKNTNQSHTPTLEALQHVETSNRAAQSSAAQQGESPFFSAAVVAKNEVFNSQSLDMANQAQSAVKAKHLDLIGAAYDGQGERVAATRGMYSEFATPLHAMRLPNTRVNVANREIEIPSDIKQYADELPQAVYQRIMSILLGPDRMDVLYDLTVKANQSSRPALWLNQHLAIEIRQQYVFLLHAEFPEHLEHLQAAMTPQLVELASQQARDVLGPTLFGEFDHAAKSNKTNVYAVLTALVDRIIQNYESVSKPITTMSIWDETIARKKAKKAKESQAAKESDDLTAAHILRG